MKFIQQCRIMITLWCHDAWGEVQLNDSLWAKKTLEMSPLNKCYSLLERIFKAKERHLPLFHMEQEKRSEGGCNSEGYLEISWTSTMELFCENSSIDCVLNTPLWALLGFSFCIYNIFSENFDLLSLMFIIYGSYYLNFRTMQNCTISSKLILYGRIVVGQCSRPFAKFLF